MFDGYDLVLGADGDVPQATPEGDSCCTDPLCIDLCGLLCSFLGLLPTGPMWDRAKEAAMGLYGNNGTRPCEPACPPSTECPTLVLHALYSARKLHWLVTSVLWPSVREGDPYTAVTTVDDWLERLNWEDCFRSHCRSVLLGDITPYEIEGPCGPVYCPVELPDDLDCAVKRGIMIAITRIQHVGILNLAALNFIIAPLGATIRPHIADDDCGADADCCSPEFIICNTGDTMPGCPTGSPECGPASVHPVIPAAFDRGCDVPAGLPQIIWPGVIAAECIVRSLMPRACPNIIHRCC